jgi:hypothetical protein
MDFDAQSAFPQWQWQYHALIGFVVFVIYIGWIIWGKQSIINEGRRIRPEITVTPSIENGSAFLIVKNNGIAKADFSAKAKLKSFTSAPHIGNKETLFQLAWESYNNVDCPLKGGGDEGRLHVAAKVADMLYNNGEMAEMPEKFKELGFKVEKTFSYKGILRLLTLVNRKLCGIHLFGWDDDGTKIPKYTCEIEVSIFSEPPLITPFKRTYKLEIIGNGMSFNEE